MIISQAAILWTMVSPSTQKIVIPLNRRISSVEERSPCKKDMVSTMVLALGLSLLFKSITHKFFQYLATLELNGIPNDVFVLTFLEAELDLLAK